jgi:hypothetical protein
MKNGYISYLKRIPVDKKTHQGEFFYKSEKSDGKSSILSGFVVLDED